MPDAHQKLARYLRVVADLMALRDWSFSLSSVPCEEGKNAQIAPTPGRKHAELRLSAHFFALSPQAQRHCLLHELIHCQLAQCQFVAEQALPKRSFHMWLTSLEYGVDGIADAVAEYFPLPCLGANQEVIDAASAPVSP